MTAFTANFKIDVEFDDPVKFAAFAALYSKLHSDFFSGETSRAGNAAIEPRRAPVAPLPHREQPALHIRGLGTKEIVESVVEASRQAAIDRDVQREIPEVKSSFVSPEPHVDSAVADTGAGLTAVAPSAEGLSEGSSKPKRHRRTKEQIAADKAREEAERNGQAPLDLPRAHGGSNTGTTAPIATPERLPDMAPAPADGPIMVPDGEVTMDHVRDAFAKLLMLKPDPSAEFSLEVLGPIGLSRCRDAKPEHYRSIVEGAARIARARGQ